MGLNKNFGTDPKRESEGAWFELDEDTKVKLRRAGGGNKEYEKLHTKLLQPHMRRLRMTQGTRIPPGLEEPLKEIQRMCYAKTIIVGWQTKVGSQWYDGIEPYTLNEEDAPEAVPYENSSELLPVTEKNLMKLLKDYPEAFTTILELCADASAFKDDMLEAMEGNS
jgi:hypothetical protein